MKRADWILILCVTFFLGSFWLIPGLYSFYTNFNANHGVIMSFIKFAVLATLGECIGLRIRVGRYNTPGFGILPRALVWGCLGVTIKIAFVIFAQGVPSFLAYMGLEGAVTALTGPMCFRRIFVAFCVSTAMNVIFAPVMMTAHRVSDIHILKHRGSLIAFTRPLHVGEILATDVDWKVMWGFVFARTIPLFWIPAHTISFLLPSDQRVLFAALLGVALGVILAVAARKKEI